MTREEFDRLPEGPPYYDYIEGEAVEVNRPTGRHQMIEMRLANALWEHVQANALGEVFPEIDVALPTGNVVGPDILFLSTERRHLYDDVKGDLYGAPDLVVEILSPSTAAYDRTEKFVHYYRAEVAWVWFVDQDSLVIEEYRWTPEGYLRSVPVNTGQLLRPGLFPGLEIDLRNLMGEIL